MTTTHGARWLLGLVAGCAWLAACGDDATGTADTVTATDTGTSGDSAADTGGVEATTEEIAQDATGLPETTAEATASETVDETVVAETVVAETVVAETTPNETAADTTPTDTTGETDGGPIEEPTPFNAKGAVTLVEQYSDGAGAVVDTYIRAHFGDHPPEYNGVRYAMAVADGACATWNRPAQPLCDPPCAEADACIADDTCAPYAKRLSAGVITVSGTVPQGFTLTPSDSGFYVATPDTAPDDLFTAGATLTVSAAGADVPAFSASIEGVSNLTLTAGTGLVELVDGTPYTVKWNPSDVGGSKIEVVLQLGWHGLPAQSIIVCHAPDADGQLVITPKVIGAFAYFDEIALFQVPSWIDRISRTFIPIPGGTVAVTAASRRSLGVSHTAAP
jgi:hypothetical protein